MTKVVELDELIERIHGVPLQLVIAITGGGSRAIAELLERPGGSRVLLEAIVPYSSAALVDFLQTSPEQFCTGATARLMAMAAYERARRLQPDAARATELVGIGCTASLASDRLKRGEHRIRVASQLHDTTAEYSLVLTKGCRT